MSMTNDERRGYHQALSDIERGVASFFNDYVYSCVRQVVETCRSMVKLPVETNAEIDK